MARDFGPALSTLSAEQRQAVAGRLRQLGVSGEVVGELFDTTRANVARWVGPTRPDYIAAKCAIIRDGLAQGKTLMRIAREQSWSYTGTCRFRLRHCV